MMAGVTEEVGKATGSFIDALKKEPLSLALVFMNLALLAFCYVILTTVAAQRKEEIALLYTDKREVRELLAKCVVPNRTNLQQLLPQIPLPYKASIPLIEEQPK
jgi:hypothetical protein